MAWLDKYKKNANSGKKTLRKNKQTGSKQTSKADEFWQCKECKVIFKDDADMILECDGGCGHYFCAKCISMPREQYTTLQRLDCFWFCPICAKKFKGQDGESNLLTDKLLNSLNEKFETLESKFQNKLNSMLNDLPEKVNKTWAEVVSENDIISNSANKLSVPVCNVKEVIKETMLTHEKEIQDREARETNIILHNVVENNDTNFSKTNDIDFVNNLFKNVLKIEDIETPKSSYRLGKQQENTLKSRPLKVCLKTKSDKYKVMASLHRLKEAGEGFNKLSVTDDMTIEERKIRKEKVIEAKNLEEKESENGKWIFRVRGPPWDLKILKLRKRVII